MDSRFASKPGLLALVVASLALNALLLGTARATPPAQEAAAGARTALDRYLALAQAYRAGDHSGSSKALSAWSQEQVMDVLGPALTPAVAGVGNAGLDERTLVTAALLHTELGLSRLARLGPMQARFHIETARELIGLLTTAPLPGFQDRWRLAVGCRLRVSYYLSEAQQLFEGSPSLGAPDPPSLVLLGSVHELRSTYRNATCPSRDECPDRSTRVSYDDRESERKEELRQATTCYRQALETEPEVHEARLRLGRTLARSGQVDAARTHLRRVLQGPRQVRTAYLAHLFLGQTFEQAGELETSVAEYRSAVEALPRGPAGRLALAHALRQLGIGPARRRRLAAPGASRACPPTLSIRGGSTRRVPRSAAETCGTTFARTPSRECYPDFAAARSGGSSETRGGEAQLRGRGRGRRG